MENRYVISVVNVMSFKTIVPNYLPHAEPLFIGI